MADGLVEVIVCVPAAQEDLALAALGEVAPAGFRHVPAEDRADTGSAEFGVYVPAAEADGVAAALRSNGLDVLSSLTESVPGGWQERWKEFHQPVIIGGLWVGPPWQVDQAPAHYKRVVIEPGQGFGTGAHATTRLMLTLLLEQPRASVLDIGCGSGVLAVAAALLGFAPVKAVDNDPAAVQSTRENLAANGVEELISVELLDVLAHPAPRADIVLANLTLEPLVRLAPRLSAPRVLVSGLLRSQVELATDAFEREQYTVRERRDRDGWAALVLESTCVDGHAMRHRNLF